MGYSGNVTSFYHDAATSGVEAGLWPEDVRAAYRLPAEALPKLLADCSGIYAFTLSAPVKEAAECIILLAAED